MKEILKVWKSWRCVVLMVLAVVAFLLAIAESDSIVALVVSKIVALALVGAVVFLFGKWMAEGKIDVLKGLEE